MGAELPVWRSLLYVPVNVEKYVEKAHERGADCIQLDLEDSVPAAEKAAARKLVAAAAKRVRRAGADVVVRINHDLAEADLQASICEDVDGIALTKTQSVDHVRRTDAMIEALEAKRGMRVGSAESLAYWAGRLSELGVSHDGIKERGGRQTLDFEDSEGQRLRLVVDDRAASPADWQPWDKSPVPAEHQIRGLGPVTLMS